MTKDAFAEEKKSRLSPTATTWPNCFDYRFSSRFLVPLTCI